MRGTAALAGLVFILSACASESPTVPSTQSTSSTRTSSTSASSPSTTTDYDSSLILEAQWEHMPDADKVKACKAKTDVVLIAALAMYGYLDDNLVPGFLSAQCPYFMATRKQ